jgi:ribosomal protein S9
MFRKEQGNHCKQKNSATFNCYFTVQSNATNVYDRNATNFDVKVNVYGGGSTGQAEAVRGISTRYV